MTTQMRIGFFVCAILAVAGIAVADEGMWMTQQWGELEPKLRAAGFEGDAKSFMELTGHPMGAIVSLGGCSASFVSPDGLIVTNYHCVRNALQYNSTPERNLLADGILASTRSEEVSAGPGPRAYVTNEVTDLTKEFESRVKGIADDRKRYDAVDQWMKERTAQCEKDGSRCRIASFFGGSRWLQFRQTELRDLRLVYAPAAGIGNFGGETDNWRWPRHTGDFAFYRAYVGADGKTKAYAADNVPYRPKRWLKVSPNGAAPGELIFVAGFPGSTKRYQTPAEIDSMTSWELPRSIRRAKEQLAILDPISAESKDLFIKVETRRRGLNNGLTKNQGVLEGLHRGGAMAEAEARQRDLEAWIAADDARRKEYGGVLPAVESLRARAAKNRERDAIFRSLYGQNSLLDAAGTLVDMAENRPKADFDRESEFQERNWTRIEEALERMQRSLDAKVDRALLRYVLREAAALPAGQRIEPLDAEAGLAPGMAEAEASRAIEALLDRLYAGTKLMDAKYRKSLFDASTAKLAEQKDSFLDLARKLQPFAEQLREERKMRTGEGYRVWASYMKALLAEGGGLVAPDANGTLRLTMGHVDGVSPKDGMRYAAQTTVEGILEKHTGEGDFDAPDKLLKAAKLRRETASPFQDASFHDVPVNFLSSADTTGGNSGSATLNAKGELCGLLFDGTYDTTISDVLYDPKTRSIHVDSRYLLWVLSEVENASALLHELGITDAVASGAGKPAGGARGTGSSSNGGSVRGR